MEPDSALIEKFRSGDEHAFEQLFHAYYKALVRYAFTILKETENAEDTVQQVFISLWEKRNAMQVHTSWRALLYRSVYNACLNRIKQQQVRRSHARQVQLYGETISVQEGLFRKELEKKLEQALDVLPEQCAKIFRMSRFEELKYQEIADRLGLSVKTVEGQMGKALRIMREQLKEYLPVALMIISQYCIYFE